MTYYCHSDLECKRSTLKVLLGETRSEGSNTSIQDVNLSALGICASLPYMNIITSSLVFLIQKDNNSQ